MSNDKQIIYMNVDDSGVLHNNERVCVYGGIAFMSQQELTEFGAMYKSLVEVTRCKYCDRTPCDHDCPELKHSLLKPADRRRFINLLKSHYLFASVINNDRVYKSVLSGKESRRRFTDYAIKRMVKKILHDLIRNETIDAAKPLTMILNIDEQTTKSDGYYTLAEGIKEELLHGIYNFDYKTKHEPLLKDELYLSVRYQNSYKHAGIQAADLVAGTVRRIMIDNEGDYNAIMGRLSFLSCKLFLP